MFTSLRQAGLLLLATTVGAAGIALAAPAPPLKTGIIKDRQAFIPQRRHQSLPGSVIGVLVSDVSAMMGQEGRSGPPDAMGFSAAGNSYRWMYVPVSEHVLINNLMVPVGEKGEQKKTYPTLSMASPTTVKRWGIDVPYALVECEVNDGQGSPAIESFVATSMKRLDGTKDYPLKVADVVADLRKRYQRYRHEEQKAIDAALAKEQKNALKDRQPTGPRETTELFYLTWLPETQHLRVHFRTRISDGAYQLGGGGINGKPVPLPLPPGRRKEVAPQLAPVPPVAVRRPAPPQFPQVRYGTTFGVEFGIAYEVNKKGKVDKILKLPFEGFHSEIPPPPAFGGPRGGLPGNRPGLPPAPLPKKD